MSGRTSRRRRTTTASERQQRDRERPEALHAQLAEQVEALVNSADWQATLAAAARFHNYSWRNVLLILRQRPDATTVAGYHTWQSMGRQVRRGERGIAILAPVTYKTSPDELGDSDEPGTVRELRGFKVEYCFDISQTESEDIPDVAPVALTGESPAELWDAVVAQIEAAGFIVRRGECVNPGANGKTNYSTHAVTVCEDLQPAQATRTLVHERAHIALYHEAALRTIGCRGHIEVEAESVAYVVCSAAGMAAASYSLPYGPAGPTAT